jgi:MscS family membrane protein
MAPERGRGRPRLRRTGSSNVRSGDMTGQCLSHHRTVEMRGGEATDVVRQPGAQHRRELGPGPFVATVLLAAFSAAAPVLLAQEGTVGESPVEASSAPAAPGEDAGASPTADATAGASAEPEEPPATLDPLRNPEATGLSLLERHPLGPPDTRSPRATLKSFLRASFGAIRLWLSHGQATPRYEAQKDRLAARAARTLDLSEVPPARRDDTAERTTLLLTEVLSRVELPDWAEIPGPEEVERDQIDRWIVPHTEIALQLVKEGPRRGEFLFSPETVARADEFWGKARHLPRRPGTVPAHAVEEYRDSPGWMIPRPWVEALPGWSRITILDDPLWKWVASLVVLGLGLALFVVVYRASLPRDEEGPDWVLRGVLLALFVMALAEGLDHLIGTQIALRSKGYAVIDTLGIVVYWLGAGWLVLAVGDVVARAIISSPRIQPRSVDAHLIRVVTHVLSLAMVFFIALQATEELGIPLSATLTGVGVGGIAVALAARPTLENFIGSLTLFADQPVRPGDFCRFGDDLGVVEEIGLRSTRLRTRDRTVATIPNAVFASQEILNYSRRDRFVVSATLGVRYETTEDQLRVVLSRLRELVARHQRLLEEKSRVRFVRFGASSLDIELFAHCNAGSWSEFQAIREDVLLNVMRILEETGVSIAFPSQTTYLGRDTPPDPAAREAATAEMRQRISEGRWPFPDLDPGESDRLHGTLEYPPRAPADDDDRSEER